MNTNVCNEDNLSVTLATQAVSDVRAQRKEERMEKTSPFFTWFFILFYTDTKLGQRYTVPKTHFGF